MLKETTIFRNHFAHILRVGFLSLILSVVSSFLYVLPSYAAFSLDSTYGTGGKVITSFGHDAGIVKQALQSDGKAVVGGAASNGNYYNWTIGRYNTDGSLDTSFGTNGIVTQDFGMDNIVHGVAIQPTDGKIVVGGADTASNGNGAGWTVARYNTNGSLDTSFGSNGIVTTPIYQGQLLDLVLQGDGKIVTVGYDGATNASIDNLILVRYNADGSLDGTFGSGGIVSIRFGGSSVDIGRAIAIQTDGKIVVAADLYVARFNPDGSVDTSFGSNGYVTNFNNVAVIASAVALQPTDGKIVVAGRTSKAFIIRYNPDGSLDTGFGSGGYNLNPFQTSASADGTSVTSFKFQSDGKILFGGGDGTNAGVGRLTTDGSGDTSFGTNGLLLTPLGTFSQFASIALQTDGKILAAGQAYNGTYGDWALARYADITNTNSAPTVGAITVSTNPVQVNTAITASAPFTDLDTTDTHTASWNWGDGNTTTGTVTESNGSGSVSDSHTYTSAGVYMLTLIVTDNHGASGQATYQYVSVYNPTAQGLFSAGQKYTSPSGAYAANTSLTGDVKFGLSYKYQGSVPVGNRQFSMDFNVANFHFNATTVSSLVISNGIGTLTGTGTVNGSGTYNFLVTGSESASTIRIQIKDSSGNVVYDTQPGAADTATPTTAVTGNVLAH